MEVTQEHCAAVSLASRLAARQNQEAEVIDLAASLSSEPMEIVGTVAEFNSLFSVIMVDGNVGVALTKWPRLCYRYGSEICSTKNCKALHICLNYLLGACKNEGEQTCPLNHHFHLGENPAPVHYGYAFKNEAVLSKLNLCKWPPTALKALVVAVETHLPLPNGVCKAHNSDGGCARGVTCPEFHGCAAFVLDGACEVDGGICPLGHEPWNQPNRAAILRSVGAKNAEFITQPRNQLCARVRFRKMLLGDPGVSSSSDSAGCGSSCSPRNGVCPAAPDNSGEPPNTSRDGNDNNNDGDGDGDQDDDDDGGGGGGGLLAIADSGVPVADNNGNGSVKEEKASPATAPTDFAGDIVVPMDVADPFAVPRPTDFVVPYAQQILDAVSGQPSSSGNAAAEEAVAKEATADAVSSDAPGPSSESTAPPRLKLKNARVLVVREEWNKSKRDEEPSGATALPSDTTDQPSTSRAFPPVERTSRLTSSVRSSSRLKRGADPFHVTDDRAWLETVRTRRAPDPLGAAPPPAAGSSERTQQDPRPGGDDPAAGHPSASANEQLPNVFGAKRPRPELLRPRGERLLGSQRSVGHHRGVGSDPLLPGPSGLASPRSSGWILPSQPPFTAQALSRWPVAHLRLLFFKVVYGFWNLRSTLKPAPDWVFSRPYHPDAVAELNMTTGDFEVLRAALRRADAEERRQVEARGTTGAGPSSLSSSSQAAYAQLKAKCEYLERQLVRTPTALGLADQLDTVRWRLGNYERLFLQTQSASTSSSSSSSAVVDLSTSTAGPGAGATGTNIWNTATPISSRAGHAIVSLNPALPSSSSSSTVAPGQSGGSDPASAPAPTNSSGQPGEVHTFPLATPRGIEVAAQLFGPTVADNWRRHVSSRSAAYVESYGQGMAVHAVGPGGVRIWYGRLGLQNPADVGAAGQPASFTAGAPAPAAHSGGTRPSALQGWSGGPPVGSTTAGWFPGIFSAPTTSSAAGAPPAGRIVVAGGGGLPLAPPYRSHLSRVHSFASQLTQAAGFPGRQPYWQKAQQAAGPADCSTPHETGRNASVVIWTVEDELDDRVDLFPAWIAELETARATGEADASLSAVDSDAIRRMAEDYPRSSFPARLGAGGGAMVTSALSKLLVNGHEYNLKRWFKAIPIRRPDATDTFHAWYYENPAEAAGVWKVLSGTFNGLTFGLAASLELEAVHARNPKACVVLHSYGLADSFVNFATMKLHKPKREIWNLKREETGTTPPLKPSWIPHHVSGMPRGILVPIPIDHPDYRSEVAHLIPSNLSLRASFMPIMNGPARHALTRVVQVYRVQNPRRRARFDERGDELRLMYAPHAPEVQLSTRLVFHGTRASSIASICVDNFDWRRAGESTGTRYGKGVYFGSSFELSCAYAVETTSPAPNVRRRFIFVAEIHEGLRVLGSPTMTYPPTWRGDVRYDTAVDCLYNPTTIVKFESDEMYPKYLIEFETW